jgi:tRNA C32,U32 (ribose-2'-O)-methylase TrmJ
MTTQEATEALVEHLEDVLRHLAYENPVPPGSCCACLQDVDTRGHLPSCAIHLALIAIEDWRE